MTERAQTFAEHRPLLFSIAYRMLGSASDAEDLVQDCYLRWQAVDSSEARSPKQYLTTAITRLAINHLQSARVRREQYVGPWLPEPVPTRSLPDPVELAESLHVAFLVVLESLSPVERAVFLLSEVFDYDAAADWQNRIARAAVLVTSKYGVPGLKHAMDLNGYYGGPPRLPLTMPSPEAKREIEQAFQGLTS